MYTVFIFNYVFSWLAVLVIVFLLAKYLLRKAVQKSLGKKKLNFVRLNKSVKLPHILLGFALIVLGFLHGVYSSENVLSFNIGTITWLVTIAFGCSWFFYKSLKVKWMKLHRILALLLVVVLSWHVVDVGINVFRILSEMKEESSYEAVFLPITGEETEGKEENNESNNNELDNNYEEIKLPYYFSFEGLELADGIYLVEEIGYSPGLLLEVTIDSNMVTRIKILSHYEVDSRYYREPMETIPVAILKGQTLDVDGISGATQTSIGIIRAVRQAVLQAMEVEKNN